MAACLTNLVIPAVEHARDGPPRKRRSRKGRRSSRARDSANFGSFASSSAWNRTFSSSVTSPSFMSATIASGIGADAVVTERDRMIDQSVQGHSDRPERILLDRFSFRPAEVRHQNCLRALFAKIANRRQAFLHPGVVGDDDLPAAPRSEH